MWKLSEYVKKNWLRIYLFLSISLLVFAYGIAVGTYKLFPYSILEDVAAAALDLARYPKHNLRLRPEKFLSAVRHHGDDVAKHTYEKAYGGVTFVTGFFGESVGMRLIGMDRRVIHEWRVSFNEVWPDAPHVSEQPHDWDIQIHGAILYPSGDVVFNFQYGGLVKVDKCSQVQWKLPHQTHHSIFEDSEGNLWVPGRRLREKSLDEFPNVPPPFQEEYIIKVSAEGEILREISILDVIFRSKYEGVLFANGLHDARIHVPLDGDFTHLNDIEILEAPLADAFPLFEEGDIMISLRNLNLLLVLDPDEARIKWSMTGPYLRQHDPDFLANGLISVFDNRQDDSAGTVFGGSRILELDPVTGGISVLYRGDKDNLFFTETMGDHQHLPNGNILITESESGHAFEVTTEGEVVWSFTNRWDDVSVAEIGRATRYPKRYAAIFESEDCQ